MLTPPTFGQIADGVSEAHLGEVFSRAGIVDRALIMAKDPTIDYPFRDALVTFRTPEYAHRAVGECPTILGRPLFGPLEPNLPLGPSTPPGSTRLNTAVHLRAMADLCWLLCDTDMFNLYELCGIQIGVTMSSSGPWPQPAGSPQADRKPVLSSDPTSPRKRSAEEIAANRARAMAKVSHLPFE